MPHASDGALGLEYEARFASGARYESPAHLGHLPMRARCVLDDPRGRGWPVGLLSRNLAMNFSLHFAVTLLLNGPLYCHALSTKQERGHVSR